MGCNGYLAKHRVSSLTVSLPLLPLTWAHPQANNCKGWPHSPQFFPPYAFKTLPTGFRLYHATRLQWLKSPVTPLL